ncbi:hypothetical protein HOY82DRAFT_544117 [Tuber indicum]|nr:hypothetical protein HOY82DRAFT_544117 [Tuber indicum]
MMGKTEFFGIQRVIIKHTEGFDCSVEEVMGDIFIQAKVQKNACSESRSGVVVAATDLDQAAITWSEIVEKMEEVLAGEKRVEKDKQDNQESLLVQAQEENLLRALEAQDEKAGKMYQETLTAGINKLVDAIANASQPEVSGGGIGQDKNMEQRREERLREQEKLLNESVEVQKVVHQKLDNSVREQAEVEKRNEERQEKIREFLQALTNKQIFIFIF